jgi:hypothetical protein
VKSFRSLPRRSSFLPLAVVVLALITVPSPASAGRTSSASTPCITVHSNYFDGFKNNPALSGSTYYEGASAYIVSRKPYVCGEFDHSGAWAMIGGANKDCDYAQAGYMYGENDVGAFNLWEFAQYNNCSSHRTYWFPNPLATGVKVAYRALYTPSCGCINMSFNGANFLATPWDPWAPGGWQIPFDTQFMGEVTTSDDSMPGTPTAKASFSALGAQLASNDALVSMPCTLMASNKDQPGNWALAVTQSCKAFDIWTK